MSAELLILAIFLTLAIIVVGWGLAAFIDLLRDKIKNLADENAELLKSLNSWKENSAIRLTCPMQYSQSLPETAADTRQWLENFAYDMYQIFQKAKSDNSRLEMNVLLPKWLGREFYPGLVYNLCSLGLKGTFTFIEKSKKDTLFPCWVLSELEEVPAELVVKEEDTQNQPSDELVVG